MPGTTIAIIATLFAFVAVAALVWWLHGIREQAKILARIGPALVEAPVYFKLVEISHEKSHFLERHGPMLQRCDVLQRAMTGKLDVAGFVGRPVASAKWYSHQDMLHAIISAAEHWRAGDRPKSGKYVFAFEEPIGEGFLKGDDNVVQTNIAAVIIRNDYVVTAFPVLTPLDESHPLN
ncbi:hypothetical protein [Yoonia sp. SS1-5]|uniref:Uncharacterized protein n=1 Tax=Yoonia rhodophyticola TaxID=3137370 RepID=A0AAN0MCK9_9RHOB